MLAHIKAALLACSLAAGIFWSVLTGLGLLLVTSPRTIQGDAVVLLSASEPLTAALDVPGRDGKHTVSLSDRPLAVSIPRIRYCSGTRWVWQPAPPPLLRLHLVVGAESYQVFRSGWFAEDAVTAVGLSEAESAYRLHVGTITQRADGVWVLPVRFEPRNATPRGFEHQPLPESGEERTA